MTTKSLFRTALMHSESTSGRCLQHEELCSVLLAAAKETIPVRKRRPKRVVCAETLALIDRRRAAKNTDRVLYNRLNRQLKKALKEDEETFWSEAASKLEGDMARGDIR